MSLPLGGRFVEPDAATIVGGTAARVDLALSASYDDYESYSAAYDFKVETGLPACLKD